MPPQFGVELTLFYKGLKRQLVTDARSSGMVVKEGKEPFSFALYRILCHGLLQGNKKEHSFAHVFLILSWNLMCRAGNTVSIKFSHVKWREDALGIYFAHMKTDQEGDRPKDARHVYANPVMPSICPVLSLAIYLSIFGFSSCGNIFPGGTQYDRYAKLLQRVMVEIEPVAEHIKALNTTPGDYGSHSARKGSASFVSACSTAGPSQSAICLRAGWSLPGVQDTYIRFEAAGDMIVGRYASGLPFDSADFAILPPFFETRDDFVASICGICFPNAPDGMLAVCEFMLASLVYHASYLEATMSKYHALFETALFRDRDLLLRLQSLVTCRRGQASDRIRPTGLPPHSTMLVMLEEQKEMVEHKIDNATSTLLNAMQMREASSPSISRQYFDDMMAKVVDAVTVRSTEAVAVALQQSGLQELAAQRRHQPSSPDNSDTHQIHLWGGEFRRVPSDFSIPKSSVALMWEQWCCGNAAKQYPPLRLLRARDVGDQEKRRLSDLRTLMKEIERQVRTLGLWQAIPTVQQAQDMYAAVEDSLPLESTTSTGRPRRTKQLQWNTVLNLLRLHRKQQRRLAVS
jgi:hypothetical protein